MAKKMSITKIAEQERKFREKYPQPKKLKREWEGFKNEISVLIKSSELTRGQVAEKLGISENLLFGKMQHPHRWKTEEIDKLIELFY